MGIGGGRKKIRIGDLLVEAGAITQEELDMALEKQKEEAVSTKGDLQVEMNRVKSSSFPNTISGVIYQSGAFDYGFNGTDGY